MKKALLKDTFLEIKNNFKRFISILLIVLLGVGFFAGIKVTSPDMKLTIDKYFDDNNVMDLKIVSTLGLTNNDIIALQDLDEVKEVYGAYSKDTIVNIDNNESVVKIHNLSNNNSSINQVTLIDGNFPENNNECLVEKSFITDTNCNIGDEIDILLETDADSEPFLKTTKLKISGIIESPLYVSIGRGSTTLLSGKINYYMYVPDNLINSEVYTEIYLTLNNAKDLYSFSTKYEVLVENTVDKLEILAEERENERYNEVISDARKEVDDAQNKLNEEKEKYEIEIADAENKIADGKKTIKESENTINLNEQKAKNEFENAHEKIRNAEIEISNNENLFNSGKASAYEKFAEIEITLESLSGKLTDLNYNLELLNSQKAILQNQENEAEKTIQDLNNSLNLATEPEEISQIQYDLNIAKITLTEIKKYLTELQENMNQANYGKTELENNILIINEQISSAKAELYEKELLLNSGKQELANQKSLLAETEKTTYETLNNARKKLENGKVELRNNESKLEDSKIKAQNEFNDAQSKIDDANNKINDIKKPTWYILDRNMNEGYASYSQDADRIANIGKVFPLVFFVVAALISLTSMTRIVEEQRVQIGTLKALGYTKFQIATKYIIYALLATSIGGYIGILIGTHFLPSIIFNIYSIIYTLPPIVLEFNIEYTAIGMLVAVCCTVGATIYSCIKELFNTPANLMRPKSPKLGKRVLLEHISFIWSRLDFLKKVTLRNMFRYKNRFLMTIIGVSGCTSLIVAGFGLRDSISHMVPAQYSEIFKYDLDISFKDETSYAEFDNINNTYNLNSIKTNIQSIEINDSTFSVQLIIPEDTQKINNFISLKSRHKDKEYVLDDNSVIITEKIANLLNINVGDSIKIKNSDDKIVSTTVGNITENYLMHYIYISPSLYKNLFDEEVSYNILLSKTNALSEDEEKELAKNLLLEDSISSVTLLSDSKGYFSEVLDSMNIVVWILITSAGILALVVLYNLANVNISERIREIATIKVLGFYNNEVYQYVSRETILLTIIGIIVGLFFGYFLNVFVLTTCELDNTMFARKIELISYIYSILITLIFSLIVNIMTHFTLKKVDMIESLKSIE